jgi:hypothetical protein
MVIWIMPTPADVPFDAHHSPILGNVRVVSILLAVLCGIVLVASGVGVLAHWELVASGAIVGAAARSHSCCSRSRRGGCWRLQSISPSLCCPGAALPDDVTRAGWLFTSRDRAARRPCAPAWGRHRRQYVGHRSADIRRLGQAVGVPPAEMSSFEEGIRSVRSRAFRRTFAQLRTPGCSTTSCHARSPRCSSPDRGLRGPASAEQLRPKLRPRPTSSGRSTDEERRSALVRPAEDAGFEPARA